MGTRNVTYVVEGGTIKVAQYGQWDGYPSGQGVTILEFLLANPDLTQFVDNLNSAYEPTPEQIREWYIEAGDDPENDTGFVNMDVADKVKEAHPSMSRDMGGEILEYINTYRCPALSLDLDFIKDSTFCEWAYCVDLDNRKLEVYGGYDAAPLPLENRFGPEAIPLIAVYSLDALPTKEEFLAELEPQD